MIETSTGVVDLLRTHCAAYGDRPAVIEAGPDGQAASTLSGAEWDRSARAVARLLRPGSRVLLLPDDGARFCVALAGVLYAGACAVPAQAPAAHRDGFVDIGVDADVDAVVADAATLARARAMWAARGARPVEWIALEDACAGEGIDEPRPVGGQEPALLLYSSGSTGTPKGTVVPHRLLRTWLDVLADRTGLPPGGSVVSWAPMHHVLGLNFVLLAVHRGGELTLLAAEDVLAEPRTWLTALSAATAPALSGAPPIGYRRCLEALADIDVAALELSGWSVAIIGSERIDPALLGSFAAAFAPAGFHPTAFFPAYGTTDVMMGTGGLRPDGPRAVRVDATELERRRVREIGQDDPARGIDLVACGRPGRGTELLLVDPDTATPVPPGVVGEIWLAGESVAPGFWRRPEATEEVFGAHLVDGSGPYLRTGDLGFDLDGELVVCGRVSEVLIVRGRNLLPHDLEASVRAANPGHRAAVFAVAHQDRDHLVVLVGTGPDDDRDAVAVAARRAVVADHEVEPDAVLAVADEDIPLTHNGKVRRAACREAFLAGAFGGGADAGPAGGDDAADAVGDLVAEVLGEPLPPDSDDIELVRLGLDSMRLITLRAALARDLGLRVAMPELAGETPAGLRARAAAAPADDTAAALVADPDARHDPFPLTDLQHAYFVGRSGGYALSGVGTQFYGEFDTEDLDVDRLAEAWRTVVERHGALRSVIRSDGTQRVLPDVPPAEITVVDLRDGPPGAADDLRAELSRRTFSDDAWPPFDIRVLRLPGGVDRVCVALDLLVMDLWSLHVVSREWEAAYRGEPLPPAPGLSFRDYVLAIGGDPAEEDRARRYWQDRLADLPPGPALPLVAAPSALAGPPRFTRRCARLDGADWSRVVDRARADGLTPAAVLIACYAATLAAWGGRRRFTLSLPTFDRRPLHPDVGGLVGDFTSVTLLEVDVLPEDSVAALAGRVQRQLLADLDHSAHSGVAVLRELARRNGDLGEVFAPVVFASASGQAGGSRVRMPLRWLGEQAHGLSQTPQVLLDHQVFEDADGLEFNWDCVEELFRPGVLDAMFDAHTGLLRQLAAPGGDAWSAPLPDPRPADQLRIADRANATAGFLPEELLADRLMERAELTPDAVALVADDATLDYRALRVHTRALAAHLRACGAGPGRVVAVRLPKSAAQVVAAIAVTLTGAAYLPLDPNLPEARRDLLLRRTRCGLVVGLGEGLPDDVVAVAVDLSAEPGEIDLPPAPARPADPAYVIFTSGSTGEPKGVVVSHRAAVNTCVDVCERFGVGGGDAVLGLSALSFDLSVWDVFGALGAGATLVLPGADDNRDPRRWLELVREHRVTVWNSVPALAGMVTDYAGGGAEVPLRLVMLSGDWIPLDLPGKLRAIAPDVRVMSLGGATEAAIWSILHEVDAVDPGWDSIPYGTPMRNQTFHVLDDRMRECPVHVTGELYIGGVGLAEGYLGDPEKSAERFIRHPRTGERLYRTGDLGRWRPEGFIEFLGREDNQVKVGGFRIELGEIEAALVACPGVAKAVAATTGDRHSKRLVAAVVRHDGEAPRNGRPTQNGQVSPNGHVPSNDHVSQDGQAPAEPDDDGLLHGIDRAEFLLARHGRRTDAGPAVPLPTAAPAPRRASRRAYAERPVPLADLAAALEPLRSHEGEPFRKFAYASAGSAYAVQTYLWVREGAVTGLAGGHYYHDPDTHGLISLAAGAGLPDGVGFGVPEHTTATAAFTVFLVADFAAIRPLYGPRARDFCLLEAGLMTQALDDAAPQHGIGLCQSGLRDPDHALRAALRLGDDHEVLHSLVGGALLPDGPAADPAAADRHAAGAPAPDPTETDARFAERVRAALAKTLPAHMVPGALGVLRSLPLTPTGKVDRGAIGELVATPGARQAPPSGPLEETVAAALRAELGRDIPATTRFLELGADSAVLVRVYRALKSELEVDFPLVAMFEHGSVRALAAHLSRRLSTPESAVPDAELARATRRARTQRVARVRPRQEPASAGEGATRS